MSIVMGVSNYVDNDMNLDQNDFKSKIETMCYFTLTNKLYVVCLFH